MHASSPACISVGYQGQMSMSRKLSWFLLEPSTNRALTLNALNAVVSNIGRQLRASSFHAIRFDHDRSNLHELAFYPTPYDLLLRDTSLCNDLLTKPCGQCFKISKANT